MKLGFDLDNVLISYPPIIPSWVFDVFYKEKDHGELKYRIPGIVEQQGRKLLHMPPLRQPIRKNLNFLQKLAPQHKHELYLISSRFGFLKKQTDTLATRFGLDRIFKKMYFNFENNQPHLFKDLIIKKENIERYIDDDLSLITYLAKNNPKSLFFWYNRTENKQLLPNLFATTDIAHILTHK